MLILLSELLSYCVLFKTALIKSGEHPRPRWTQVFRPAPISASTDLYTRVLFYSDKNINDKLPPSLFEFHHLWLESLLHRSQSYYLSYVLQTLKLFYRHRLVEIIALHIRAPIAFKKFSLVGSLYAFCYHTDLQIIYQLYHVAHNGSSFLRVP